MRNGDLGCSHVRVLGVRCIFEDGLSYVFVYNLYLNE